MIQSQPIFLIKRKKDVRYEIIEYRRTGSTGRHYDAHKDVYSVAVRRPDGEIEVKTQPYKSLVKSEALKRTPIVRGVFIFHRIAGGGDEVSDIFRQLF